MHQEAMHHALFQVRKSHATIGRKEAELGHLGNQPNKDYLLKGNGRPRVYPPDTKPVRVHLFGSTREAMERLAESTGS